MTFLAFLYRRHRFVHCRTSVSLTGLVVDSPPPERRGQPAHYFLHVYIRLAIGARSFRDRASSAQRHRP